MNDFDHIIQATREEFEPSCADRDRVRRRLAASVAGAAVTGSLVAQGSAGVTKAVLLRAGSLGGLAKLFFGSMACTFIGAGAIYLVTRAHLQPPTHATRPLQSAAVRAAQQLNPAPALPSASPAAMESAGPAESTAVTATTAGEPRKGENSARRPSASAVSSTPAPDLDAELASLRAVRQAAASGQPERAEQLLDALDQQRPRGLLMEERAALRATTVCDAGDSPRAERWAQDFLHLYPRSVYAAKVRRVCRLAVQPVPAPSAAASASFTDPSVAGH